jgi:short-subunit dehydrogenase
MKLKQALRHPQTRAIAPYALPTVAAALGAGMYLLSRNKPAESRSLRGRVALITGGSRGLGLELARKLAAEGCRLILTARDETELSRAAEELKAKGAEVETIVCDLTDAADISRLATEAPKAYGQVNILINNAGKISVGPVQAFHEPDFRESMELMFWAGVKLTLAFLPQFTASGDADIVNITSIGGKIAVPHLLPYVAAKFAMTGFSEGLQAEIRQKGVHVLTVTPGLLRTGSFLKAEFAGDHDREYRWFALGAAVPGLSMEVSRAAEQITEALITRKRELVITAPANAAARLYGGFPELGLTILDLVNRWILPASRPESSRKTGEELHPKQPAVFRALLGFGERAAAKQNERR